LRKQPRIFAERGIVLLDVLGEGVDPGRGLDHRGPRMSGRDASRELVCHHKIDLPRVGEAIERLRLVEAPHVDRPLDRLAVAAERKGAVATARHRDDATVKLRRKGPVGLDLGEAGGLALRERREVEEGETDGALDLEGALAGQEHDSGVGVDAAHGDPAVRRRAREQR
jgi:hypothetical protein